jgi:hypothetical protein
MAAVQCSTAASTTVLCTYYVYTRVLYVCTMADCAQCKLQMTRTHNYGTMAPSKMNKTPASADHDVRSSVVGRRSSDVRCVTICDLWFVICDTCDVWCVMCDVWCVMCDVWCVMCDVWCVMCDVWCVVPSCDGVMYDVWCVTMWWCRSVVVLCAVVVSDVVRYIYIYASFIVQKCIMFLCYIL